MNNSMQLLAKWEFTRTLFLRQAESSQSADHFQKKISVSSSERLQESYRNKRQFSGGASSLAKRLETQEMALLPVLKLARFGRQNKIVKKNKIKPHQILSQTREPGTNLNSSDPHRATKGLLDRGAMERTQIQTSRPMRAEEEELRGRRLRIIIIKRPQEEERHVKRAQIRRLKTTLESERFLVLSGSILSFLGRF
jgi:hypothetical protein